MKREEIEKFINTAREDIIMRIDLMAALVDAMITTAPSSLATWKLANMVDAKAILMEVHNQMLQCPAGPCNTPIEAARRLDAIATSEATLREAAKLIEELAVEADEPKEPAQFQTPTFITTEVGLN